MENGLAFKGLAVTTKKIFVPTYHTHNTLWTKWYRSSLLCKKSDKGLKLAKLIMTSSVPIPSLK